MDDPRCSQMFPDVRSLPKLPSSANFCAILVTSTQEYLLCYVQASSEYNSINTNSCDVNKYNSPGSWQYLCLYFEESTSPHLQTPPPPRQQHVPPQYAPLHYDNTPEYM